LNHVGTEVGWTYGVWYVEWLETIEVVVVVNVWTNDCGILAIPGGSVGVGSGEVNLVTTGVVDGTDGVTAVGNKVIEATTGWE
jgi:hypothetical protein